MSKVNQIQRALLELGGGEFQKLADAFLMEKGFGRINSIGSVVAANKVKPGTPDTLIATLNGNYIFAEHTTQQGGLLDKLTGDLAKCFDEAKTGVPIAKIERVVFCFTGRLNAEEENFLAEECQQKGVNLDLFGMDALAFDLYSKYPGLALDFLGVQIDTGQIVAPDQFVSLYNKSRLATRLDLGFHFRDEELRQLLNALNSKTLVTLSGRAGVGKSRLALEVCRRFGEEHPDYEIMCIFGRNRDLWEDLQSRFRRPGNFLIFVDDANRVSRFEYVIDLLLHQHEHQQIKVLATVRDYALSKIRDAARSLRGCAEVELEPFTDDQIKGLITDEYEIRNHHYLERLVEIAQGNARLAVMAAEVAKDGPLNSIYDVSGLYDTYFSSIRDDLRGEGVELGKPDLLKVAAVVSFFKAVDRSAEEMMGSIEEAFGISPAAFWQAADRLHELEILDMHEDEVVRVSDQVLGTYLFYLAVFKDRVLDFGAFLRDFFPKMRHRLIDSINPILNAYDSERVIDAMRPHVEQAWSILEEKRNEEGLLQLLDVFWFVMRTKTLLWAQKQIDELEAEPIEVSKISFEKSSKVVPSPSILSVLRPFAFVEINEASIAVDLLTRNIAKRPSQVPLLLRVLLEDYGFRPDSYLRGFEIQVAVINVIWKWAGDGEVLYSLLFLAVASDFLGTHFENHKMKGSREFQITRFELPNTSELVSLRETIWKKVTALYKYKDLQKDVLKLIGNYSSDRLRLTNSEVIKGDAEYVLPFLESVLNREVYEHCILLHDYLDLLERHGMEVPEGLRERFSNETYALAKVLFPKWDEHLELGLSYEEKVKLTQDRLEQQTAGYTFDDYALFFCNCLMIRETQEERPNGYRLQGGVINVLLSLADRNANLYDRVIELYLELQDPFRLNGYGLVQKLIEHRGHDATLQLLSKREYPTKRRWLFHFHEVLPAKVVNKDLLDHLYDLYEAAEQGDLPFGFDYLLKYLVVDSLIVPKVVAIIMRKIDREPQFAHALTMLFNPDTEVAKKLLELFAVDHDLLKQVYLVAEGAGHPSDYDGKFFGKLIDLAPEFINSYISWKYRNTEKGWLNSHDDHRDYTFIWSRSDYHEIMDRVVETITKHEEECFISSDPYLKAFFRSRGDSGHSKEQTQKRQDAYLLNLIDERSEDVEFMRKLFGFLSTFSPERRRLFVERFVQRNKSFEVFEGVRLEPNSWSWSGSRVPMLQGRVDYWESLLTFMTSVELLPHKQYIERNIQLLRAEIEREKKKDFIQD